jgi:tetratricopeptide (TPR) repeat protein
MRNFVTFWAVILMSAMPLAAADTKAAPKADFATFKEAYAAGNQALKDRDFTGAVAAYEAAEGLATTPKGKSQAANAAGWASLKGRQWDAAKGAFERAVEADGQNKVALKNLGHANFRRYEYGFSGVEELKEAVKNLEASGENQELLERAKGALSREEGWAQATPVAEMSGAGMSYKALLSLGDDLQGQGRFEQAVKVFAKAESSAASPMGKGTAANRQGKALLDARKPQDSVAHFERAVKLVPEEKVFWNNLGFSNWVLYDSGKGGVADLKEAVDAFYKSNSIDPSYHAEMMRMALDELREVDAEAAKAYSVKDEAEGEDSK